MKSDEWVKFKRKEVTIRLYRSTTVEAKATLKAQIFHIFNLAVKETFLQLHHDCLNSLTLNCSTSLFSNFNDFSINNNNTHADGQFDLFWMGVRFSKVFCYTIQPAFLGYYIFSFTINFVRSKNGISLRHFNKFEQISYLAISWLSIRFCHIHWLGSSFHCEMGFL